LYYMSRHWGITVSKSCDAKGCCKTNNATLNITFNAWGRTDFNNGEDFTGTAFGITVTIEDALINECNKEYNWGAKDFNIDAIS